MDEDETMPELDPTEDDSDSDADAIERSDELIELEAIEANQRLWLRTLLAIATMAPLGADDDHSDAERKAHCRARAAACDRMARICRADVIEGR